MTTNAQVVPFSFQSHAIRTVVIDGNPWFICTDVAEALDYRDAHNAARCLDDDEKDTQIVSTPSGDQSLTIISESGLYALVLRSRKPEARKFAKWVTAEVLPAIRKTGSYTSPQVGAGETAKPNDSFVFRLKALSMSLTIERQLVNHFMAGGDEGARWLLDFTHDGKPYISEVPKDAHVRSCASSRTTSRPLT
jgi:prophage antirepressor-like protein